MQDGETGVNGVLRVRKVVVNRSSRTTECRNLNDKIEEVEGEKRGMVEDLIKLRFLLS